MASETWRLNASNGLGGSPSSYFDNYAAQVGALEGSSGLDSDLMGPGGSVFNGRFSGLGGGFGGAYSLYNDPAILAMTPEERMKYFAKMQKEQAIIAIETQKELNKMQWGAQVDQKHQSEAMTAKANAPDNRIAEISIELQRYAKANDQVNAQMAYNKLILAVGEKQNGVSGIVAVSTDGTAEKNTTMSKEEINNLAKIHYQNVTKESLVDSFAMNGSNEFVSGLKEGALGLGLFTTPLSAKDNIVTITGEQKSPTDNALRWTGRALGAIATVAVLFIGAKFLKGRGNKLLTEVEQLTQDLTKAKSALQKAQGRNNSPNVSNLVRKHLATVDSLNEKLLVSKIAEKERHLAEAQKVAANNSAAKSIVRQLETDIAALKAKKPELELKKLEALTGKSATRQQQGQTQNSNSSSINPITPRIVTPVVGTSAPAPSTATTSGFSTVAVTTNTPVANKPVVRISRAAMDERIANSGFVKRKNFFAEMKNIQTPGENAFGNGIDKEARKQAWELIKDKKDLTEVAWEQIRNLGFPV